MIEYILNLSAIWLVGLILFDSILQKETYHTYNRLFLLGTLCLGVIIPLWQWNIDSIVYSNSYTEEVINQTYVLKEQVSENTNSFLINWDSLLSTIYYTGVAIALLLLLKEVFTIVIHFSLGHKTKNNGYTLIELNRTIAPFSIFNNIFISNKEQYDDKELEMIINHELRHHTLLHIIDVVMIRALSVVFWFHPLVYIYSKRILMIHEYQADNIMKSNISSYGKFLIEQSSLGTAPLLSHSLTRSPLKKRIKMLVKQSGKMTRIKQLVVAPLLLSIFLCCTSQIKDKRTTDGNKITYKGNVFEKMTFQPDSIYVEDPVTGEIKISISKREGPIYKMNGKKILNTSQAPPMETTNFVNNLKADIGNAIKPFLKKMPDGSYRYTIKNIIVDKKGKVVYYELQDHKEALDFVAKKEYELSRKARKKIETTLLKVLEASTSEIVTKNGEPIAYRTQIEDYFNIIK